MKTSNSQTALVQLNNLLSEIKADSYPTPEMDSVMKQVKKIIATLGGNAPAKKVAAKKAPAKKVVVKKAPAKKAIAKKTTAKK